VTGIDQSYRTARRVAIAGIGVSGLLACSNVIVGMLAHSTSVIATGFEFAGDVIASMIVVIGWERPADRPTKITHTGTGASRLFPRSSWA
jgi:divalent metal cation (Fe/Co/Zn/Cd) transporter